MLSKPSAESSAGRSVEASICRPSTSRTALAYSVLFNRCRDLVPGNGRTSAGAVEALRQLAGEGVEHRALGP